MTQLQIALPGKHRQAAVPQPEQRGQQGGQALRPSGGSRVSQDGVGGTWTIYLRVLLDR